MGVGDAVASAKSLVKFGIDLTVALLSCATGDSNSGDAIDKAIKAIAFAKKIVQEEGLMYPNLIEGPLQFDAAVDPAIAAAAVRQRIF